MCLLTVFYKFVSCKVYLPVQGIRSNPNLAFVKWIVYLHHFGATSLFTMRQFGAARFAGNDRLYRLPDIA